MADAPSGSEAILGTALHVRQMREDDQLVYGHIRWLFEGGNNSGGRAQEVRRALSPLIQDDERVEIREERVVPDHRVQTNNGADRLFRISSSRQAVYPNGGRSVSLDKMTHGCDSVVRVSRKDDMVILTFFIPDESVRSPRNGGRRRRRRPEHRR